MEGSFHSPYGNAQDLSYLLVFVTLGEEEERDKVFVEYEISGASDDREARQVTRAVSSSALVKTAMFGRDPNWGRIICAGGNAGVPFDYRKVDLYLGDARQQVQVLEKG